MYRNVTVTGGLACHLVNLTIFFLYTVSVKYMITTKYLLSREIFLLSYEDIIIANFGACPKLATLPSEF